MTLTLADRLLGRTGWHRRTYPVWQAMEERVAAMDDQDALIAELVRQRDEARSMAGAASMQVEEFRTRVNEAEARADQAERTATRLRAELANVTAVSRPMYAEADTQELFLPAFEVMSLQARGAA